MERPDGGWKGWLEDRATHRAPVDAHFARAETWLRDRLPLALASILELGPGHENDLARPYRLQGAAVVQADVDPEMEGVTDLRPYWSEAPAGIRRLPWDEDSFHLVLAREVLEHVADLSAMLFQVHRVLKPGGRLWFSTPFVFPLHDFEKGDYWRISPSAWLWLAKQTGFTACDAVAARMLWDSWQYPVSVLGWAEK